MALIGYAPVSTDDQSLGPQLDALRKAGCGEMIEEHASGGERSRPQRAAALARVKRDDTLVVARIDRLRRWPGVRSPPCRLEGRSSGQGTGAIPASSACARMAIQGHFHRGPGHESRPGRGRRLLATSDTRQDKPVFFLMSRPLRRDKPVYRA
jgi:hypothetical protein